MKRPTITLLARYVLLFIVLLIISVALGYAVQQIPLIQLFDNYLYLRINGLPHNALTRTIVGPFDLWFLPYQQIFFLPAFFYFLIGGFLLYLARFKRPSLKPAIVSLLLGFALAGILLDVDWHFIFRHRPFETLTSPIDQVSRATLMKFPSYPSGHVRDTSMVATIIARFLQKFIIPMIIFVAFIAFTRVYSGAHYPTDVLAGIIFGYGIGEISIGVTKTLQMNFGKNNKRKS